MNSSTAQAEPSKWARWQTLSPFTAHEIDEHQTRIGQPLHHGSTAAEIENAINRYFRTAG